MVNFSAGEEPKRVLVVDDTALGRRVMGRLLDNTFEVTTAVSAEHALYLLQWEERFDALLTDQHMVWMTGLELLEHVRSSNPAVRRVLTSASPVPGCAGHLASGLVHAILYKPFDLPSAIAALTGSALRRR